MVVSGSPAGSMRGRHLGPFVAAVGGLVDAPSDSRPRTRESASRKCTRTIPLRPSSFFHVRPLSSVFQMPRSVTIQPEDSSRMNSETGRSFTSLSVQCLPPSDVRTGRPARGRSFLRSRRRRCSAAPKGTGCREYRKPNQPGRGRIESSSAIQRAEQTARPSSSAAASVSARVNCRAHVPFLKTPGRGRQPPACPPTWKA